MRDNIMTKIKCSNERQYNDQNKCSYERQYND